MFDQLSALARYCLVADFPHTKATAFLELLDATIGTAQGAVVPYDLESALAQIETVAPELPPTPPFRRLVTAARR